MPCGLCEPLTPHEFESEQDALAALAELARDEPEAADEVAAIPFDNDGKACGPAVKGSSLLPKAA